jgi:hypothetical protein
MIIIEWRRKVINTCIADQYVFINNTPLNSQPPDIIQEGPPVQKNQLDKQHYIHNYLQSFNTLLS